MKEPPPHISKKASASSICARGSGGHGPASSPPPLRSPPARTAPSQTVEALEAVCQSRQTISKQQSQQEEQCCEQRWAESEPSCSDELEKRSDVVDSLGADAIWAQEVEGPPSKAPPPQSPIYRVMPAPPAPRALHETMPLPPSAPDSAQTSVEATFCSSAPSVPPEHIAKYKAMPTRPPPPKCAVLADSSGEPSPPCAWSAAGGKHVCMGPPPALSSMRSSPVEPKRYKAPPAECALSSTDSDLPQRSGMTCVSEKHPPGAAQKKVKAPPQRPQ